jgi:hypothetical protein
MYIHEINRMSQNVTKCTIKYYKSRLYPRRSHMRLDRISARRIVWSDPPKPVGPKTGFWGI